MNYPFILKCDVMVHVLELMEEEPVDLKLKIESIKSFVEKVSKNLKFILLNRILSQAPSFIYPLPAHDFD